MKPFNSGIRTTTIGLVLVAVAITLMVISVRVPYSTKRTVGIYVASSLEPAVKGRVEDLQPQLDRQLLVTSAGSQTVARQIANGKPVDIVFLASTRWMDYLEERNRIRPDSRKELLSNRLVLIGSEDSVAIESIDDREGSCLVVLTVKEEIIRTKITRETVEELSLAEDRSVEVLLKTHSLDVLPL